MKNNQWGDKMQTSLRRHNSAKRKQTLLQRIWKARYIYLFLMPGLIVLIVFRYGSMYGVILAFKDFKASKGILGSDWVGLYHFRRLFRTPEAVKAIWTTLRISLLRLLICFPVPIALALLINEMPFKRLGRIYQTIYTFPHFLSWVIAAGMLRTLLKDSGAINAILTSLGFEKVNFLGSPSIFEGLLYGSSIWKEAGYSCILYLAAISAIDPGLYESAELDGASRLQRMRYITLPSMRGIITISLIMTISGMMNAGFDQIFNMRNAVVSNSVQIIDTYVYDITFGATPNYGFSTAVGLFKGVINCIMLLIANSTIKKISGQSIYGSE